MVYCADSANAQEAMQRIQAAYEITEEPVRELQKLVKEVINE